MTAPLTAPDWGSYLWFGRSIGRYMGYGEDSALWDHTQAQTIDEIIQRGMQRYYDPAPVDGVKHQWSFLMPNGLLTTSANQREYDLPDDFDRLHGEIAFDESDVYYPPIDVTSDERLRAMGNHDDTTGYPQMAAIRYPASSGLTAQTQRITFWPMPDASYRLRFQYYAIPRLISADFPYPLGGRVHAEGLLASMLAVAEEIKEGEPGAKAESYMIRLAAAIVADMRRAPQRLGYNGDGRRGAGLYRISNSPVQYNGTEYQSD